MHGQNHIKLTAPFCKKCNIKTWDKVLTKVFLIILCFWYLRLYWLCLGFWFRTFSLKNITIIF